jgi:hypothetical protein
MSEEFSREDLHYIAGFDDGCNFMVHEIERWRRRPDVAGTSFDWAVAALLDHLKQTKETNTPVK